MSIPRSPRCGPPIGYGRPSPWPGKSAAAKGSSSTTTSPGTSPTPKPSTPTKEPGKSTRSSLVAPQPGTALLFGSRRRHSAQVTAFLSIQRSCMTATKKFSTLLGVSALALALVGCSSNGDNTDSPEPGTQPPADSGELTTINVGTLPVVETAVLMLGEEQGFFAERGIELDYTLAQSGSAIVAGIASKQYDVGFSATLSVYAAAQRGLPLVMLTAASASNEEPDKGTNDIIVRPDGSITSILDLEGKRVGVNAVESISDILAKNGMEAEGGDLDSIEFVEIGFGDMIPQLESGNIDAFVV